MVASTATTQGRLLGIAAIFRAAVGQHALQLDALLVEEGNDAVVQKIGGGKRRLSVIKLCEGDFRVGDAGKVLTRSFLVREVWGLGSHVQYLRIYVRQLRQKIEAQPKRPAHIITEAGIGYRLRVHGASESLQSL